MERNSTKRKPNFTEDENLFLIDQYKHHKAVLSFKLNSSAMLYNEKYQIWQKIRDALNERNPHTIRTVKEVRKKWKNMVCNARKKALFFKRSQTEQGGKGSKAHFKLLTVTKKIVELKEDFATLHDSSDTSAPEAFAFPPDGNMEVLIPNGQCVVIKTENIDEDMEDTSLQTKQQGSEPALSVEVDDAVVTEMPARLAPSPPAEKWFPTLATVTEPSVTSFSIAMNGRPIIGSTTQESFTSSSIAMKCRPIIRSATQKSLTSSSQFAVDNHHVSSLPAPSQSTANEKQLESGGEKETFAGLGNVTSSHTASELLENSRAAPTETVSNNRNTAPIHRQTLPQTMINLGLSRVAQRKRPLFSRVSHSHIMQPKKVRLNTPVSYRQDTNGSNLDMDSKQVEKERLVIATQRLSLDKERLSLEREKLSMKKERHALKKEKLSLEKQKLFLEVQWLKYELQQINGVKSNDK